MRKSDLFVLSLLALVGSTAWANQTYSFRGTPYTEASAPYQIGEQVSGSLELTVPLPANLALTDIPRANVVGFSFTDAHQVRNFPDTTVCRLMLGTDAQGDINAWSFWMRAQNLSPGNVRASLETYNMPGFQGDLVGSGNYPGACDSGVLNPRAVTLTPGTWTRPALFANGFE